MKVNPYFVFLDNIRSEESCVKYLESVIWGGVPKCPRCNSLNPYKTKEGWKCSNTSCYKKFTIRYGTIFHRSRIPLRVWLHVMYLFVNDKRGISSEQISEQFYIGQEAAWFMLQRLREMLGNVEDIEMGLNDVVEVDEMNVGGIDGNKHFIKKKKKRKKGQKKKGKVKLTYEGKVYKEKTKVIGMVERGLKSEDKKKILRYPKVKMEMIKANSSTECQGFINRNLKDNRTVYTDTHTAYSGLDNQYEHDKVCHSGKQYVKGEVHTNTIENVWSIVKPAMGATYNRVTEKHMNRYLNEYAGRFNTRGMTSIERLEYFIKRSDCYISYEKLIAS